MARTYPGINLGAGLDPRTRAALLAIDRYLRDAQVPVGNTPTAGGVDLIKVNSDAGIFGEVNLQDGTAIDITRSGQNVTVAVAAAGIDHGGLGGLADDDHTQYILASGTRAFTGNQSHGGFSLTSVNQITATGRIQTDDDIFITAAAKGLVLKDAQATPHFWRINVNNATGHIQADDLGTTFP